MFPFIKQTFPDSNPVSEMTIVLFKMSNGYDFIKNLYSFRGFGLGR